MTKVIGSSDVYSRKVIDRQQDRLERLILSYKGRIRVLEDQYEELLGKYSFLVELLGRSKNS